MSFAGKTAFVTGAGQGIGQALVRQLAKRGVQVCVVDLDSVSAENTASEIGGISLTCDVSKASELESAIETAREKLGQIDMVISNAGFAHGALDGPASADDQQWQMSWDVHVMAHLRACRAVLPEMLERGEGWLISVASAAGLLSQIGDAPYSATKHAAVSLAQSLAIEHGHQGIRVSTVCPLYVATPLLGYDADQPNDRPNDRVLTAAEVAATIVQGIEEERFMILPHPEAAAHFQRRAADTDRWIKGMQRLRGDAFESGNPQHFVDLHRLI
ncbi:SDR family NAD(P)-dependent oxidoreductase [Thalassococcus lentus]|uniref:SDR family NAD(P)-dependent oxidoreductase n=1 Tax=Thalassococcus lentus TaxID=1210524 RepID=A0ABT4XNA2_9RHOB|nr:SDR family NAD(P)-dependent oxidoreductase [Thalassococcus lentus]MDA7423421.1 SDR family NAD(P)-dependent oxidoreductase [Thalassococcus lentus]